MDEIEVLVKQYDSFIRLYVDETRVCWNLISIFVALNVGLATVLAHMLPQDLSQIFPHNFPFQPFGRLWIITLVGTMANLIGSALFLRNRAYRERWLRKALNIEEEIKKRGINLSETIKITNDFEGFHKIFKWLMQRAKLDNAHRWSLVLAILWIIISLWALFVALTSKILGCF